MEKTKMSLVHTNRTEKHEGIWFGVWEGVTRKGEKVHCYIASIKPIDENGKSEPKFYK